MHLRFREQQGKKRLINSLLKKLIVNHSFRFPTNGSE